MIQIVKSWLRFFGLFFREYCDFQFDKTKSGALCFGELGAICPKAGGEYQYIKMTYGRMASFANLWNLIIVNSMGKFSKKKDVGL